MPFKINEATIASVREDLAARCGDEHEAMILAWREHELVGILGIYGGYPEMVFINRWHPILQETKSWKEIGLKIIEACKSYVKEQGYNRLESLLSPINIEREDTRVRYQDLYLKAGFHLASKEAKMKMNPNEFELPSMAPNIPEDIIFEEIEARSNDELREPLIRTFQVGGDRLFLDMTVSQTLTTFEYWLSRKKPFQRASILATNSDRVVGFSIARPTKEGGANFGPIGIISEFRGLGIAKAMLHENIRRLKEDNIEHADLEVDVTNTPAVSLYTKFGFKPQYTQEYYSWKVD
jgi:ribosomal protein S18 acetylase RimI-like enzyme